MTKKSKKEDERKLYAFLAAFLSIIGFVIALVAWKDDKYVMFYAKQSLVVFIVAVLANILQVIALIPFMGWLVAAALQVIVLVLWILSWVYALSGEQKEVPVVGRYAKHFNF